MKTQKISLALISAMLLFTLAACSSSDSAASPSEDQETTSSSEESTANIEDNVEAEKEFAYNESEDMSLFENQDYYSNELYTDKPDTISDTTFGQVSVPNEDIAFVSLDGSDSLQSSNFSGDYIITLETSEKSGYTDAEALADQIIAEMQANGSPDTEKTKTEFKGYNGYQCFGSFEEGTMRIVNIFKLDSGNIRLISVEGPTYGTYDIYSIYDLVNDSYKTPASQEVIVEESEYTEDAETAQEWTEE